MRYLALILLFVSVNCNCQFINVIGGGNPIIDSDTAKWYFKNGGTDGNDGHTPATAKETFPHLLTLDLDPGDSVFFNKGDTWRIVNDDIQGNLPWIGAEGNHITFTSYGIGDRPRILGSDTITNWVNLLESGLVGYYNFDEASPGDLLDQVGSNDGTVTGATYEVEGKINYCYTFDGNDNIGTVASPLSADNLTFTVWIKPDESDNARTIIGWADAAGPQFRVEDDENLYLASQLTTLIGESTSPVTNEVWNHVAVTYDVDGNYEFFINGATAGNGTTDLTLSWSAMEIGSRSGGTANFFEGEIDELAIYNRVLSAEEIRSIYRSGNGKTLPFDLWYGYDASLEAFSNGRVFFEELDDSIKWGNPQDVIGDIDSAYEYRYSNDTVYVYSTSDPSTAFASVEISQCPEGILVLRSDQDSAEYYTFDGWEIAYGSGYGVGSNYPGGSPSGRELSGFEVRNCLIHHLNKKDGSYGFGVQPVMNNVVIENNEIHNCGRRGVSINPDASFLADTIYNILIQDNHFHDGWHTTGPDIACVGAHSVVFDSIIIRRNIIEDDTSVTYSGGLGSTGISFILNSSSASRMINIWIYNNLIRHTSGWGINFYVTANASSLFDDIYIHNNTLYDFHPDNDDYTTLLSFNQISGTYTDIYVRNNITYVSHGDATRANNVYPSGWDGTGITFDYNLHYNTTGTNAFHYDGTSYTQAQWSTYQSASGWESNSPTPVDPLFKDAPDSLVVYSNSDAVDAGIAIAGYDTDYEENAVGSPPNIGAYERTQTYLGIDYDPTNWYVDATDGDDGFSGHHPDSAKQTISAVNSISFSAGDTCYFDGDEIYRGQISNPEDGASGNHVVFTISPYGSSVKPIITTAIDESSTSDWVDQGGNLWLNEDALFTGANYNVGNIILRTTATSDAISVGYNRELEADVNDTIGEFFYDTGDDDLLVYCTSNPATYWGAMAIPDNNYINIAINSSIVDGGNSDYITYDGLAFNWTGRHGISYNAATNNITVKNCDFNIIGGSENYDGAGFQLGNGAEFYTNNYTDITITGCKFYQIFDASITPQYAAAGLELNNFYINGNLFIEVRYAFEFAWGVDGEAHTIHFNNNTCYRTSNYVFKKDNRWSTSLEQMSFVTFYAEQNAANTDVDIYNNIFYYEDLTNIASAGVRLNFFPWPAHIDCDYNQYYSPDAFSGDHCLGNYSGSEKYTLGAWQSSPGMDSNGYNSDPDFKSPITNFRVGPGDAVDGGVAVAEYDYDYEGVEVVDPPHIGALETTED